MAKPAAPHVVILGRPEALRPLFFRPMILCALDAARALGPPSITVLAGAGEREFREQCRGYPEVAVRREAAPGPEADVLVLPADAPLLTARTLHELAARRAESDAPCAVARAPGGPPVAWCFRSGELPSRLTEDDPAVPAGAAETAPADPAEGIRVDDLYAHWRAASALQERFNRALMLAGTALQDPRATVIDPGCRIGRGVSIEGGCTVIDSVLEEGARLEAFCRVERSVIGAGSRILQGTVVREARVGRDCRVGPYAHLRPGTRLGDDVRVGNFVELEEAQVGRKAVLGGGFLTCGSGAGAPKRRTVIGDGVFVGGASHALAPVTIGAGSFVATGTSVTEDVPPDSFVISRARQVVKAGYSRKYGKAKG